MSARVISDPAEVASEQKRVAEAMDAAHPSLAAGCHTCGATPGNACVSGEHGSPREPHRRRVADFAAHGAARPASEMALHGLKESIRSQLLALCNEEMTAKNLGRIQRFCSSMGLAMIALEKPEHLVRDRFGSGGGVTAYNPISLGPIQLQDYTADADPEASAPLATAPAAETYGTNASRSLIAEAAKLGKEIVNAQIAGQEAARKASSLPELVTALVLAKKQRLGKGVIDAIERQIAEASASHGAV